MKFFLRHKNKIISWFYPYTAKTIVTELVFSLQFLQKMESVSDHLIREMNIIVLCNSRI